MSTPPPPPPPRQLLITLQKSRINNEAVMMLHLHPPGEPPVASVALTRYECGKVGSPLKRFCRNGT